MYHPLTRVDVGGADVDDSGADLDVLIDHLAVGGGVELWLVVVHVKHVHVHHRHARSWGAAAVTRQYFQCV